ncbi:MAG: hypothetical protein ACE5JZ_05980 [Kiloniellales bacterium]
MAADPALPDAPGVWATDAKGRPVLVHLYQGGDYRLSDITDNFQLGRPDPAAGKENPVLVLTRKELRTLKTMADAYSFDYEDGFIEMCHEIERFARTQPGEELRLIANF